MKRFLSIILVATCLACLFYTTDAKAIVLDGEKQNVKHIKENLNIKNKYLDNIIEGKITAKDDYKIDDKSEFVQAVDRLDITDSNYSEDLNAIYKKTNPDVVNQVVEDQCKELTNAVDEISELDPDEKHYYEDSEGNITSEEVYKLESGASVIVEGVDENETEISGKTIGNFLIPCTSADFKTADWVTDKSKYKQIGARRYTVFYNLLVAGEKKGYISVTLHYYIHQSSITVTDVEAWKMGSDSPLSITRNGKAVPGKTTKITKKGEVIYGKQEYYITTSKSVTTTSGTSVGVDIGVSISGQATTSITWKKSETKLHKLFAKVELLKFERNGAVIKQYGRCKFVD